ncbi:uncharacterized protein LOC115617907 [Strigops habroptila]|uniref:uncharacterized protein LOC115617907 n=1 Tax=Strigops habroptila TaxID=2489341 RepID=UPI0011CF2D4C|nr:uncharacterized protein LOC115617907 [Strigops habroptila]
MYEETERTPSRKETKRHSLKPPLQFLAAGPPGPFPAAGSCRQEAPTSRFRRSQRVTRPSSGAQPRRWAGGRDYRLGKRENPPGPGATRGETRRDGSRTEGSPTAAAFHRLSRALGPQDTATPRCNEAGHRHRARPEPRPLKPKPTWTAPLPAPRPPAPRSPLLCEPRRAADGPAALAPPIPAPPPMGAAGGCR